MLCRSWRIKDIILSPFSLSENHTLIRGSNAFLMYHSSGSSSHLTSPKLTSSHLMIQNTSPHLTSIHRIISSHLTSPQPTSPNLTLQFDVTWPHFTSTYPTPPHLTFLDNSSNLTVQPRACLQTIGFRIHIDSPELRRFVFIVVISVQFTANKMSSYLPENLSVDH